MIGKYIVKVWENVPGFLKNRFVLFLSVFFIYMLFIDKNDWVTQYRLYKTELQLRRAKAKYIEQIQEAKVMKEKLEEEKERIAREKYFIHKPGEDVYVIIRK